MKKRILIVNNNMHIGGVQKALLSLLRSISNDYDITLLLFHPYGEYISEIPDNVKIISPKSAYRYLGMSKYDVEKNHIAKFFRSFYAAITRLFGRNIAIYLMSFTQSKLKGFDVAISYLQNGADKMFYGGCNDFVLKHCVADQRISVLHCDYMNCGANTQKNAALYKRFDKIACCSQGCMDSFISVLPDLKEKCFVMKNCHDFKSITAAVAIEAPKLNNDAVNILTVARLGKEKGVLRGVKCIKRLIDSGNKVNYYIIGDGIQRNEIERYIAENDLSCHVFLLGELINPYAYMKAADMLLIPSYSEAAPLVIGESAYLGTPVLSVKTSSAIEMIEDTCFGWVSENNEDALYQKLSEVVSSKKEMSEISKELSKLTFDNYDAVKQFEAIIN